MRNFNSQKIISKITSIALLFLLVFVAPKSPAAFYDQRPDILSVDPIDHIKDSDNTLAEWNKASYGHFVLLAELLTFFPDSEFYFLARDIEYLHDMAKVLLKNNSVLKKRLHLVPISTHLSGQSENVRLYLEQEGLTSKNLGNRSALIVDSCCSGSIPYAIINAFQGKKVDIQGFLITANAYPSSELAKSHGAEGGEIEQLPHYNNSATEYVKTSEKIRIQTGSAPDERPTALKMMQQIRFDEDNAKSRKEFFQLLGLMRTVYAYIVKNSPYKETTLAQAESALSKMKTEFDIEPSIFLTDVENMNRKQYASIDAARLYSAKNIDLTQVQNSSKTKVTKKDVAQLFHDLAVDPDNHNEVLQRVKSFTNVEFKDVFIGALKILNNSTPKDLKLTEDEYKKLVRSWVRATKDNSYPYTSFAHEVTLTLSELLLKTGESKKAIEHLAEHHSGVSEKKIAQFIISAIAADEYKYFGSSAIRKSVTEFKMLTSSPIIFKTVIKDFAENAKPQDVMKVTEKILENLDRFDHKYADFKVLNDVLRKLITASPKISRDMVQSLLSSHNANTELDPYGMGYKNVAQPFLKWFFSQGSKFSIDAKNLKLTDTQAYNVTQQRWKVKPSVQDIIEYPSLKSKAKLCAISTQNK